MGPNDFGRVPTIFGPSYFVKALEKSLNIACILDDCAFIWWFVGFGQRHIARHRVGLHMYYVAGFYRSHNATAFDVRCLLTYITKIHTKVFTIIGFLMLLNEFRLIGREF